MKFDLSDDGFVIVGLGNPGSEYIGTRHNFGFTVLNYLQRETGSASSFEFFGEVQAEIAAVELTGCSVLLVKPLTFMNNSGIAVRALLERLQVDDLQRLLVVHDDLDLDLGRIKLKQGGGSGGHNGLKSLIEELGSSSFLRLRLGIGEQHRVSEETIGFVLSPFSAAEQPLVDEVKLRSSAGITALLNSGIAAAMNLVNRRITVEV